MKFKEEIEKDGLIPTYHVEEEFEELLKTPNKPSARILKTKLGLKTLAFLRKIQKENNHSWYREIKERSMQNPDKVALFYRANKITYREMFEKADMYAKSMVECGIEKGDEIPCFLANTPELIYVMLAANKIGAVLNLMGTSLNPEYMKEILDKSGNKLLFVTDSFYEDVKEEINTQEYDNMVAISLADSLPEKPEECDEYVPELDSYYHFDNMVPKMKEENNFLSVNEFEKLGKNSIIPVVDDNDLDTVFTITYTSGSTRVGHPSQIIHSNRSYVVGGIYNDTNLTGSPSVPEIRGLAHIHSESNTDLVTSISDNLIKRGTVALEPEYDKEKMLDVILLNKPVHLDATTSFLIEAAKQYLIDKKYNEDGKSIKFPQMLVTMAVGEGTSPGEEKFLNTFLKKTKAGSNISLSGLKLPYGPLSIGGGDCEHGGIFYTLLKGLQSKINFLKLGKNDYGMVPVPFAVVTALKQLDNGEWEECEYGEPGIIVANSITSMVGYKGDPKKTLSKVIRDRYGRDWLSCDVYGCINKLGNVIVKGRKEDVISLDNGISVPLYYIDEIVCKDSKNILSCTTVKCETESGSVPVINVEFYPGIKKDKGLIIKSLMERCYRHLPEEICDLIKIRIIDYDKSYPLNGSGKRSAAHLKEMQLDRVLDPNFNKTKDHPKKRILRYSSELRKSS